VAAAALISIKYRQSVPIRYLLSKKISA
jgi:hypothetical protein